MSNTFYAPGPQRAAKVGDLFAKVAQRYDLLNDLQSFGLHRRWKRRAAQLATVQPGDCVLDVCCGTGDLAFALATQGAGVVGLDFSEAMLAVAKARGQRAEDRRQKTEDRRPTSVLRPPSSVLRPPTAVCFVHGDAQHISFPDATFDIVTVGYGLRNLASWEAGLGEMVRVAKPGGRLLVLDFGKPDCTLWRAVYFSYLKLFVPLLGLIFCHNARAYAYILESLRHYPAQRGVEARMRQLGLTNVRVVKLLGGAMCINLGQKPE